MVIIHHLHNKNYFLENKIIQPIMFKLGVRIRIMPRARYWKNSMNNHVKGVDVYRSDKSNTVSK